MYTIEKLSILFGILFLFTSSFIDTNNALEMKQRRLSPTFTLTFVHGDPDAMKSHMDALKFCRSLGKPSADAEIAYNVSQTNAPVSKASNVQTVAPTESTATTVKTTVASEATAKPTVASTKATEKPVTSETDKTRYRSDLVSVHDGHMVNELMRWILNLEKRQFWIGGVVKMIEHEFETGQSLRHLLQLWTDRTPANFRFLHFENPMMNRMRPNELACISVDYASGKWGLHSCSTPMYFVCETVELENNENSISEGLEKKADNEEAKKTTVVSLTEAVGQTSQTTLAAGVTEQQTSTTLKATSATEMKTTEAAATSTTVPPTTAIPATTVSTQ